MQKVRFVSTRSQFNSKNRDFKEMVTAHMAQDIEVIIKTGGRTPVKKGELKSGVRHTRTQKGYRVESNAPHSAVQEIGVRRGARAFRQYTTPGTGKGWFKDAIDRVQSKKDNYVREAARSARL